VSNALAMALAECQDHLSEYAFDLRFFQPPVWFRLQQPVQW